MKTKILVLGFRRELLKEIERRGITYVVWAPKKFKLNGLKPKRYIKEEYFTSVPTLENILEREKLKSVTHVIASAEAGVVCAYHLRRLLGARINSKSLVDRCTDKLKMKEYLSSFDIPMAKFIEVDKDCDISAAKKLLKMPIVCKDRKNSGSRGTVICHSREEIETAIGPMRMMESFVDAKEGSVECFVENGEIIFFNITQYLEKTSVNVVPASFNAKETQAILELNERVIKSLKIKWGLTHMEFYRTKPDPTFGEIALRPPGGYIMELIKLAYDFCPWKVFLNIELGEVVDLNGEAKKHTAAMIFHPGAGTLRKIKGVTKVKNNSAVSQFKIKVKPGDTISSRIGTGEDVGHLLLHAQDNVLLRSKIKEIQKTLAFDIIEID